ncbi:MAG: type II toxin-antitoxin system VapC family toxin [Myxococcota bacterium]|jgi:PIN domain nuclease of toxin-antitoxin system
MISVVADTHALVWHLTDPKRLGKGAHRAFAAVDAGRWLCHVPAVVLIEVTLLHERGRLRLGAGQVLEGIAGHSGYAVLPLDVQQALEFASLPGVRDPMDRLVAAAARATGSKLISVDEALDDLGPERVWD